MAKLPCILVTFVLCSVGVHLLESVGNDGTTCGSRRREREFQVQVLYTEPRLFARFVLNKNSSKHADISKSNVSVTDGRETAALRQIDRLTPAHLGTLCNAVESSLCRKISPQEPAVGHTGYSPTMRSFENRFVSAKRRFRESADRVRGTFN